MIFEISGDFKSFKEILGVFSTFIREKYGKIPLITANRRKKRKENIKKLLQIQNLFAIINAVKL